MSLNSSLGLGILLSAKDEASATLDRFGAAMKRTHGISAEAAAGIGADLKSFGVGAAVMGAGLVGLSLLGPALEESKQFGKAIALVATEVDKATFSQEEMKKVTRDMALQFGGMPVDEAKALYKGVALGANDAAKSTALMTAVNQLAVAGNADLSTAMDAVGTSLNAYHLQASDAGMVSDALFAAMRGGDTTVQDLASSIGAVSSSAYVLGVNIQETLGAMSVMTNKNGNAAQSVAYLHGALSSIIHPMKDARGEAARLGIDFSTTAIRAKGFSGFLHSITDSAKFNTLTLEKLFGHSTEGFQAMSMIAGDMGAFDAQMKAMGESTGSTAAGFKTMSMTLAQQEKLYEAAKKTALGYIGEALEPLQAKVVGFATDAINAFNKLSPATQAFIVKAFAVAASIAVVVGGLVAVKAAIGLASVAFSLAGTSMAATLLPVVAAVALVAAGLAVFHEAYDRDLGGFRAFVDDTVGKVKLAWAALGQVFADGGFSGAVLDDLNKADNQGVKSWVIDVYVSIKRLQHFFGELADSFSEGLKKAEPAFDAFTLALGRLGTAFGIVGTDTDANGKAFDAYGAAGKSVGEKLAKIVEVALYLGAAFVDLVTWCKPAIDAFIDLVKWAVASDEAMALLRDVMIAFALVKVVDGTMAMVAGIRSIAAAATAANISIAPLAAAVGALYLAYSQWQQLKAEWNDNAASDMWKKFQNDIGVDSDESHGHRMGIVNGADDPRAWEELQKRRSENSQFTSATPPMPSPGPMASVDVAQGGVSQDSFVRLTAAVQAKPPVQVDASSSVYIDGEEIKSWAQSQSVGDGVRNGVPMTPGT